MSESHILTLDDLKVTVEVEDDGDVGIYLKAGGGATFFLNPDHLAEIVTFAETHGQISILAPA